MKLILGLVFFLLFFNGYAQLPENQFLYGNLGFSLGNFWGGTVGINFAVNNKYSLQLEYSGTSRKSKSVPSDYVIGLFDVFSFGTTTPKDRIQSLRFLAGKVKTIDQSGIVRINFKAGISYLTITEPYGWEKTNSVFIKSNYTWKYNTTHQIGFVLKPEFESLFANFIGVSITPYCELTTNYNAFGIEFGVLLGKVKSNL